MLWIFLAYIMIILIGQYLKEDIVLYPPTEVLTLTGIVEDSNVTGTGRQSITFRTDDVRIQCLLEEGEIVFLGQQITVVGRVQALERPTNKGAFDEWRYYSKNKIHYKMFPEVLEKGEIIKSFSVYINQFRKKLSDIYDSVLPEKESAIMKAMIIGDKSGLTDYLRELYRVAGIFHLLAISGLHISIFALLVNIFLPKIGVGRKAADIITIALLIFYTVLTGASIATIRAAIMGIVVLIGYLLHRDNDVLSAISFAGLGLLIYEPTYLFDIGFQYSFVAITSLVMFTESVEKLVLTGTRYVPAVNRIFQNPYIKKYFAGCIVGDLATIPLTAYYFYYIQPYGFFTNLIIASSVQFLIMLGLLVAIAGVVSQTLAMFVAMPLYALLKMYEYICLFFGSMPFSEVLTGRPSLIFIVLFYLFLFAIKHDFSKINTKKNFVYIVCFLLLGNFVLENVLPKKLEITLLDVGQGDSIFFQKGNTTFVVDGGNRTALIPFMDYQGIQKVDVAFVTHAHDDHITGITELAEQNRVSQVILPIEPKDEDNLYERLRNACEENGIEIHFMKENDWIEWDKDFIVRCIFPIDEYSSSANNGSLVLRVEYRDISVLLTGDIEREAEDRLLRQDSNLRADILKLAHHGSKTSSKAEFIDAVNPVMAIVSTGRNNTYGHPSPEVTERLEERGIILYDTAQNGAVTIITDGYIKKVVTMR